MSLERLKQLYKAEIECLDAFMELLTIERKAVQDSDSQKLEQNATDKNELLNTLVNIDTQRKECQLGLMELNDASISAIIQHHDELLKQRLKEFQHQNRINGAIIQCAGKVTLDTLHILSGKSSESAGLYDNKGNSDKAEHSGNSLARI